LAGHKWSEIRPWNYCDGMQRYRFELGLGMYYCPACKARALSIGPGGVPAGTCPVKKAAPAAAR
jgi:hypothetical protein